MIKLNAWKSPTLAGGAALGALSVAVFGAGALRAQAPHGDPGAPVAAPLTAAMSQEAEATYKQRCAMCHDQGEVMRAPTRASLKTMPVQQIRFALTEGVMKQQAAGLSAAQIEALSAHLGEPAAAPAVAAAPAAPAAAPQQGSTAPVNAGARPVAAAAPAGDWIEPIRCAEGQRTVDLSGKKALTMVGVDPANSRRMTAAQAGLKTADLRNLEVAWTIAFPQTNGLRSTPLVVGDTVFYSTGAPGRVLALDAKSGCVKWDHNAGGPLRSSMSFGDIGGGRQALIFGDARGSVHAIDAKTGAGIWKVDPRHDKSVPITGAPLLYQDRIIVPLSASDVGRAGDPNYKCCTSHGAVVAIAASDGRTLWTAHTMDDAKPLNRKNKNGVDMFGPSGAPIWSSPAIDVKRGLVYATTGENTSPPATDTSDAVMALDLKTGERRWHYQALARDIWNMSCIPGRPGANCPFTDEESVLKDYDFGAGAILAKAGRKDIVLAGQKSGHIWALDPDQKGKVLWSQRFGEGTALGGVHWGIAADEKRVYVPINDPLQPGGKGAPGVHAVDLASGKVLWSHAAQPDCGNDRDKRVVNCTTKYGFSVAPLVVDGALVTGTLDGKLMIFDAASGKVMFTHDTAVLFESKTGVKGKGGSIDSQSLAAGAGMVFVGSGYGSFNQTPGNVLIAYRPKRGA